MIGWEPTNPVHGSAPVFFRLRMRPVTLGHLVLLHDAGINLEDECSFEDMLLAAFICSDDHKTRRADIARWWAPRFFKWWGWTCRKLNPIAESERFQDWFFRQLKGPITKSKAESERRESGAPLHCNMMATALGLLQLSRTEALDCTIKELKQLVCALGEARGEMDLWTKQDEERREMSVKLGLVPARN